MIVVRISPLHALDRDTTKHDMIFDQDATPLDHISHDDDEAIGEMNPHGQNFTKPHELNRNNHPELKLLKLK